MQSAIGLAYLSLGHKSGLVVSTPEGNVQVVILEKAPTLLQVQQTVGAEGGYLEQIRTSSGRLAFCHEEGRRLQMPLNIYACNFLNVEFLLFGKVVIMVGVAVKNSNWVLEPDSKKGGSY